MAVDDSQDQQAGAGVEGFGERVIYQMRMISVAHGHWLDAELRKYDLNRAKWGALSQLARVDPEALSGSVLGRRAGVTAQSMSTAIAHLLGRGLVLRTPNPSHGRILDVRITPDGYELVEQIQVRMRQLERRALAPLTGAQADALREALRLMMIDLGLYLGRPGTD